MTCLAHCIGLKKSSMSKVTAPLANFLRESRMEMGLSQGKAAELAKVAQSTLSSYEVGRVSPELGTLIRLCRTYGKSLNEAAQAMGLVTEE